MLFWKSRKRFESLVLKEADSMYRLAVRLTGNRTQAEDLVQDTFLRAYRAFDQFELRAGGVRPWLFKILHNVFFNDLAVRKRRHELKDEPIWELLADHHPHTWMATDLDHIDWDQFDEEVKGGIESLAPEYRVVLLLWSLEQMSYREIADICDVPVGTVMSRLFRARKELALRLSGYARSHRLVNVPKAEPFHIDKNAKITVLRGI
jgi:RNA polymerase sigma-70 factor (ECF subfamily)